MWHAPSLSFRTRSWGFPKSSRAFLFCGHRETSKIAAASKILESDDQKLSHARIELTHLANDASNWPTEYRKTDDKSFRWISLGETPLETWDCDPSTQKTNSSRYGICLLNLLTFLTICFFWIFSYLWATKKKSHMLKMSNQKKKLARALQWA